MATIRLLAVQSIDGYMIGSDSDCHAPVMEDLEIARDNATHLLNEDVSLSMLCDWADNEDDSVSYLIEAKTATADIITAMLRMRLVDEIILYTVPVIAGDGKRLFKRQIPETFWKCTGTKTTKYGVAVSVFKRQKSEK